MTKPATPRDVAARIGRLVDSTPGSEPASTSAQWLYAPRDYERATLRRLVDDGFLSNRNVDYPSTAAAPSESVLFRSHSMPDHIIRSTRDALGAATIKLEGTSAQSDWDASVDGQSWYPAIKRAGLTVAPHLVGEPIVEVRLVQDDDVFSASTIVLGRPVVDCVGTPTIAVGETLDEARAPFGESRVEVVQRPDGRWTTRQEHGFRFVRIADVDAAHVVVETRVRPEASSGAFVTSDDTITALWEAGRRTLHTCMQSLMVDGVKRDRMPWMGDQIVGLLANAYSIGDPQIALDSMIALADPVGGHVNGIVDYSLWWVIGVGMACRQFGRGWLSPFEAERLHQFVSRLTASTDSRGLLHPHDELHSFEGAGVGGIFIDWGFDRHEPESLTVVQMLWFWALTSTAEVLHAVGHPGAERWRSHASRVRDVLLAKAWLSEDDQWSATLERPRPGSSYPNVIAVLSGIAPERHTVSASNAIIDDPARTPFMRSLALDALGILGRRSSALNDLVASWGAFLDRGSSTFWEEFPSDTVPDTEMYGRPFGRSMCHAWSSGPASLLPKLILGIEPTSDGWATVAVGPELGALDWAAATIPTPHGPLTVIADHDTVTVWAPPGVTVEEPREGARPLVVLRGESPL